MRKFVIAAVAALPLLSGGCIAKTAFDVVTLPVKATAQVADWATTSQEESDRNYGRKMREKEARDGKAMRKYCREHKEECRDGPPDGFRADPGGNRDD